MTDTTQPTAYTLDAVHSSASFKARHMMVSNVRGHFNSISGSLTFDRASPANSQVEATIETDSIDTAQPDRDAHVKSADFLDAAQYPTITFRSTHVTPKGPGEASVTGDLTIHGVTKQITLEVEGGGQEINDGHGNLRIGFSSDVKISRKEFGLTFNPALETGGVLVGDEITVSLEVEFVRKA